MSSESKSDNHSLDTSPDFPVVGIGASAGGLDALRKLLENLPEHSGIAFVVIQHLAETQVSMLPEILSRTATLPVVKIENNIKIKPDFIYVIPSAGLITIIDGVLQLKPKHGAPKPIDEFLKSLALERKNKAIGVVLSGTGNDGTEGLKAIKFEGGITFAQDPKTAQYPDMPQSAIASDNVDFVLPPEKIANELTEIVKHPELISKRKKDEQTEIENEPALQKIFALLQSTFGVNFTHYKKNTITRRITRRMILKKQENIEQYAKYLKGYPDELQALFDDLLIGVTEFFREPPTFELLKEVVFPEFIKTHSKNQPIRIWIPGCSTGEEAYSIAIAIQEFFDEKNAVELPLQVFGTDVNDKNIEKARKGIYPRSIEEHFPQKLLAKFFTPTNGHYQVAKRIRDVCVFAKHDITKAPPFSNMDLIMCRNVLIYFDSMLQERVIPLFNYGLRANGFLVLGESESIGKFTNLFEAVSKKSAVYKKKESPPQIELPIATPDGFVVHQRAIKEPEKKDMASLLESRIDNLLMSEYVPATFVVNNSLDVVSLRGQVNSYISMEPGAPKFSIAKIVKKELRPAIQTSIYRAKKERKQVQDIVHFEADGIERVVKVQIKPLYLSKHEEMFFLVMLEETKVNVPPVKAERKMPESALHEQVRELSEALESTKQTLQTSVEQQEATNEELRSTMEEVQSSNEELQSTNEELETAKEELQSSNEELNTVNSELKERNDTLAKVNDDLTNLLNNVDAAIIIVDAILRVRRFTNPAQEFLRLIPSDVGRKITDIRLNIPVDNLEKDLFSAINELKTVRIEINAQDNLWYHVRIKPYISEAKKIDGAVITIVDITDIKKAQENLVFQANLLDNVRDAVLAISTSTVITYWSKSAEALFGWTAKEVIGQPYSKVLQPEVSNASEVQQQQELIQRLSRSVQYKGEAQYRLKNGPSIFVDLASTVIRGQKGEIKDIVISLRDMTERKKLESKLEAYAKNLELLIEERTKQLRNAERLAAIGQTAGMVGHDIRNPLQSIVSDTYLLKNELASMPDGESKSNMQESVSNIEDQAVYIDKIVKDLQDFARVVKPEFVMADLNNVIQDALSNVRIPENIEVSVNVDSNVSKLKLDLTLFRRILTNLITNAIQAMPNGGKLTIESLREDNKALICVTDTGVGVPDEVKHKLFTPMVTTKAKGQGFGLAVVKRFVEAQGGTITFQSQKGIGTKFIIEFLLT